MLLLLIVAAALIGVFLYSIIKAMKQNKNRFLWIVGALVSGVFTYVIVTPILFWLTMPLWSHKTIIELPLNGLAESKIAVGLSPGHYGIIVSRDAEGPMNDEKWNVTYLLTIPSENIYIERTAMIDFTMRVVSNNRERFELKQKAEGILTAKALNSINSKTKVEIVKNPYP